MREVNNRTDNGYLDGASTVIYWGTTYNWIMTGSGPSVRVLSLTVENNGAKKCRAAVLGR